MTPAIALLVMGAILLRAGWKNQNIIDVALGRDEQRDAGGVPDVPDVAVGSDASSPSGGDVMDARVGGGLVRLFHEMNRIVGLELPYVWGGGHAGYPHEGPFDCSGAVSYVLHAAGLMKGPPRISTQFMLWGSPGRGRDFTVYSNPTHVFIRDERTGRDWGTTRTTGNGGPAWHHHPTGGFVARCHPGNRRADTSGRLPVNVGSHRSGN